MSRSAPPLQCIFVGGPKSAAICFLPCTAGDKYGLNEREDGILCLDASDADITPVCVHDRLNTGASAAATVTRSGAFNQCVLMPDGVEVCTTRLEAGATCNSTQLFEACRCGHVYRGNKCIKQVTGGVLHDEDVGPYSQGSPTRGEPMSYCDDYCGGEKRYMSQRRNGQDVVNLTWRPKDECAKGFRSKRKFEAGSLCVDGGGMLQGDMVCSPETKCWAKKVGIRESCNCLGKTSLFRLFRCMWKGLVSTRFAGGQIKLISTSEASVKQAPIVPRGVRRDTFGHLGAGKRMKESPVQVFPVTMFA